MSSILTEIYLNEAKKFKINQSNDECKCKCKLEKKKMKEKNKMKEKKKMKKKMKQKKQNFELKEESFLKKIKRNNLIKENSEEPPSDKGLEYSLPNGKRIKHDESKEPEKIEMEHKNTGLWFANKLLKIFSQNLDIDENLVKNKTDQIIKDISDLLPSLYKKISQDHIRESENYYVWLQWMEKNMKKYETPKEFIKNILLKNDSEE